MAERRPLVLINGAFQELPVGDTLPGAGGVQNNFAATTDPAVGNDNTEGYAVGSVWVNTTADTAWVCLDASTGAAVWTESTAAGGGGSMTDAEVKTAYENNADTNAFTDAEKSKLAAIEASATADQTGAEIEALLDAELGQTDWKTGGGGGSSNPFPNVHRYWRLYFTETGTQGDICTLGDIQFRETVGGADVIGEATMSAPFTDYGPIANATDGDSSTFWGTNQDLDLNDVYIQADFGAGNEKWINEFAITSRTISGAQGYRGFRLEWSDDGTTWTTEADYSGEATWGNNDTRVYAGGPQHVLIGEVADISDFPTTHTAGQFLRRTLADDGYEFADAPGISAEALGEHRYWRILGTVAGTYNGGVLGALELYEHEGGANIATNSLNQIAAAGSSGNAFDGNDTGNPWIGASGSVATGESWVGYDFGDGNAVNIRAFQFTTRSSPNQNQIWDEWDLQYSDDGVNWFTKQSYTDVASWSASEVRDYDVAQNTHLTDFDDVDISTVQATGDALVWNGTKWVPKAVQMDQSEITATAYSTVSSDFAGNAIRRMNNASAITVTVEPSMTEGEPCTFIQTGAGTVTFAAGVGVTIHSLDSNLAIAGQYGSATLIPDANAADTYYLVGALA